MPYSSQLSIFHSHLLLDYAGRSWWECWKCKSSSVHRADPDFLTSVVVQQASVRVIRGLALGSLNENTQGQFLLREVKMAGALSVILSLAGFLRTILFRTPLPEAIAVTASLSLVRLALFSNCLALYSGSLLSSAQIVFSSICLGAILPLVLKWTGVDPVHSSTTIQVVMDILGVVLAVVVSSFLLDTPVGQFIITRLT